MLTRRGLAILAAATGAALVVGYARRSPAFDGQKLGVSEAHRLAGLGLITLLDIRRPDEWAATGVGKGAHPLDMRRDDFLDELTRLTGGARDAPVALICARGVRSARLANRLKAAGYSHIIDVPEGMLGSGAGPGWLAAGLPVTTVPVTATQD